MFECGRRFTSILAFDFAFFGRRPRTQPSTRDTTTKDTAFVESTSTDSSAGLLLRRKWIRLVVVVWCGVCACGWWWWWWWWGQAVLALSLHRRGLPLHVSSHRLREDVVRTFKMTSKARGLFQRTAGKISGVRAVGVCASLSLSRRRAGHRWRKSNVVS